MNTMITDAAVDAAYRAAATVCAEQDGESIEESLFTDAEHMAEMRPILRAALEAALPLLTVAPEAGNPVSVSERERFEAGIGVGSRVSVDGHPATVTGLDPYTERFKIEWDAPKGGTMYRLREEMCPIAARQPVGEVVAYVVTPFRIAKDGSYENGPDELVFADEAGEYAKRCGLPLYAAQQPAQVSYSIDADPAGIRARVADSITGALMVGAQGHTAPPAGHWLEPFWNMARAEASMQTVDLGRFRKLASWVANCAGHGINDAQRRMGEELLALIDSQGNGNG